MTVVFAIFGLLYTAMFIAWIEFYTTYLKKLI